MSLKMLFRKYFGYQIGLLFVSTQWNWLDFLGLSGLLHVLEAFRWAQLKPATVIHVPDRLQQHTHFGDPSTDRKGHCTSMVKGITPQTHLPKESVKGTCLYRELMQDHWRQCFIWSKHLLPDLCSHSDVGYWWNASTGLWLFVLCSGLFKHLLALTKRHNTPTYGRKIKTSKLSQNLQRKN